MTWTTLGPASRRAGGHITGRVLDMAFDLYLAVVDSTGAVVPGDGQPDRLANPFREGGVVDSPFIVSDYQFGAEAPVSTGGGAGTGRVELQELEVGMFDDSAAGVLFGAACAGRHFRSIDLLAVTVGDDGPTVIAGVGVAPAVLAGISWSGGTGGLRRRLQIAGEVFSVGSATQLPDGSITPFQFTSYNTSTGTVS